jgi:hypothetical protein
MKGKSISIKLLAVAILALFAVVAIAQDTTQTQVTADQSSHSAKVARGEVVYVSGNEVVVRMESGEIRNLTVPDGATATVDGKTITVKDLRPGMKLQKTITTTTTPETVTTIRTIQGKVWQVIAPKTVILTLPDGTNKKYNVPKDQVFKIDGQDKTVFELQKGMNVTATVLTRVPRTAIAQEQAVTGKMPVPPATPEIQGALLIEDAAPAKVEVAQNETKLPKTASNLPLIGLLGIGFLLVGVGFRRFQNS